MAQLVGVPPVAQSLPGVVVQPDEPLQAGGNLQTLIAAAPWDQPQQPLAAPQQEVAKAPQPSPQSQTMSAPEMEENGSSKEAISGLLQRLQLSTLHGMVKTVEVRHAGTLTSSRFLYLTNDEAGSLPLESMKKVRGELNLGNYSLVMRLMPCGFGNDWWKAFPYWGPRFPEKRTPETDVDVEPTEHQMLLLAKEVLLPLAIKAKALVIGQEACSLTAAFFQVCGAIQTEFQQRGKECPFRVLIMCRAPFFEQVAREDDSSVVSNFRRQSSKWSKKAKDFTKALDMRYGNDPAYWPRLDLFHGEYSIIMFECLGPDGRVNEKPFLGFQHNFIAALMDDVPVLGVQTYGTERMNFVPTMAEHVGRKMPLFLIDSRKRKNLGSLKVEDTDPELRALSEKLHKAGVADWYSTSTLAYVKSAIDRRRRLINNDDSADVDQRKMWIHQAILQKRREHARKHAGSPLSRLAEKQKKKKEKQGLIPTASEGGEETEEQQLVMGTNIVMTYTGRELEWEMTRRHDRFREAIACIQQTQTWSEFRDVVEEQWLKIRGCAFHLSKGLRKFVDEHPWAELCDAGEQPGLGWKMGRYRIVVKPELEPNAADKSAFENARACLVKLFEGEFSFSSGLDKNRLTTRAFTSEDDTWMAVYEVLQSENVATGSLHDLRDCKRKLMQLSHLDYLPPENSLEALVLLRRAWTLVDFYKYQSRIYGFIAKTLYMSLLILEIIVITIVTLRSAAVEHWPGVSEFFTRARLAENVLLGISLVALLFSGYTSLISPNRKYMRLKSAAMRIESEIWKFRTRMGEYRLVDAALLGEMAADRENEKSFAENLKSIEEGLRQTAGLGRTPFYAVTTTLPDTVANPFLESHRSALKRWRDGLLKSLSAQAHHNQYNMGRAGPKLGADNHHSPETLDRYVQLRLVPARDAIQKKIPRLVRLNSILQATILISSTVCAALAALTNGWMTAVVAAITGSVAAWQEFTGVELKLDKLSEIARKLDDWILWWQALPDEDKRVMKNCQDLVLEAEFQIVSQMTTTSGTTSSQQQKPKAGEQPGGPMI
mmetsp:Transcript_119727/g.298628  ORF Transcript_119727/g.298628 Transcript_119727/m.298628 type:complete len:1053 (+) Transcript_119727:117-3275(+)